MSKAKPPMAQRAQPQGTSTDRLDERESPGPGWPEIAVGLIVLAMVGYGGGSQLPRLGLDPVASGLLLNALSGLACLAGFAAAASLRIRSLAAFGVRRTSMRWLGIGAALGVGPS